MIKILFNLLLCVLLIGCHNSTFYKAEMLDEVKGKDTTVAFFVIKKDSAYMGVYRFNKTTVSTGLIVFDYVSKEDTFSVLCDTFNKKCSRLFTKGDTVVLDIENEKYYTINGTDYKVLKLIGNKNVTDGDFSLFVSPKFGLLINKSNTWREAKVVCPDKSSSNYLQLTTLLYRVQTDDEFFPNPIPNIKKFKMPKVE